MARLPLELLSLAQLDGAARARLDECCEKLLGICRWFHIGMNGMLFPSEHGDPRLNTPYLADLIAGRGPRERERLEQFIVRLGELLELYEMGYEGTLEILDAEGEPDVRALMRVAYVARPFWRWY